MKLSLWSLRKLAFLNVFITDKLFRMFRPYFLSLDFVSLNCHHVCMCGLLTPWVSWGEFLVWGALPGLLPQPVGRRLPSAATGAVRRESKLVVRLQKRVSLSRMA